MKIQQVKIKEFKKIKDFEQDFKGQNVLICGENTLGKSTIMQFIEIALGKQTNIPPNAEGEGVVITNKDGKEFTFQVKFKDGKPVVTVITPEGLKDNRKGTLEMICGAMGFDIYKFVEQSKTVSGRKEQIETIKGFLPEIIRKDLAKYETDVQCRYDERTGLSKDLKVIEGAIKTHPLINLSATELAKIKHTDITKVFSDLQAAEKHNKTVTEVQTRKNSRQAEIEEHLIEVKELETKLEKLRETILDKEQKNIQADTFLKLKENQPIVTTQFETQINEANGNNEKFNQYTELKKHLSKKTELENNVGELTVQIEVGRQMIADTVRDMDIIDGLSFNDETLLLNGIPVNPSSLSTSEIMQLGYQLKNIENPDAPLFLEGLESFGEDKFNELLEFSKKYNVQFFGEQVERGTKEIRFELLSA